RVLLVTTPHGALVVEAVEVLAPVVDRTERLHRALLQVGATQHLPLGVRERGVESALVALPLASKRSQRSPFIGHGSFLSLDASSTRSLGRTDVVDPLRACCPPAPDDPHAVAHSESDFPSRKVVTPTT